MLQVIHDVNGGTTRVVQVPEPIAGRGSVVVGNMCSVVSAGTERYVVKLAQSNLISKARQRPDHVRRVLQKLRDEGVLSTLAQVRAKLQEPLALGYSAAGVVLACGAGVQDLRPGDRVAVASSHAAVVAVGRNLCAPIPENVSFEQAAYAPLGAIALQGVRLAEVELGSRVLVLGLGLLGLITVGLLRAQGCRVWGIDLDPSRASLARSFGAEITTSSVDPKGDLASVGPQGFDAVLITAAAPGNETIELAADVVRNRGRVVAVGLVGLNVPREPFFRKEVELTVSHSMGVGRGDEQYESAAEDYPVGQARWTMRRNIESVLSAIATGALPVSMLTSHRFPVEDAPAAYDLITKGKTAQLGVLLQYDDAARKSEARFPLLKTSRARSTRLRLSLIGVGNYARLMMLPRLAQEKGVTLRGICSAKGLNAAETGDRYGFEYATSNVDELWQDHDTDAVIIATRHDLHAELVVAALKAGKHVFVEKPLCLTLNELNAIETAISEAERPVLMVGFNRRFASGLLRLAELFRTVRPLSIHYRFAVPELPDSSWVHNIEVGGGRIIGEACHAIDACSAIVGSQPRRVFAESIAANGSLSRGDDRVFITLRHHDGSISNVSYQSGADRSMPAERVEVIGGGQSAVLDNWSELISWSGGARKRESLDKDKGHTACLSAFIRACAGGEPPLSWDDMRATSLAAILADQSTREGVAFDIDQVV
jgi:predicted dehydrogenase/threonine dehydrogenase-like Zn-dependent dehydrogenase